MRRLWIYFIYLIIVWGSIRYFFRFSEVIEELWFKPVFWLIPLFWWNLSEKKPVRFFGGEVGKSLGIGLLVGVFYFLITRHGVFADFRSLGWDVVGVAIATAIVEELTFSGYLLGYLEKIKGPSYGNLLLISLMAIVIRIPIWIFIFKLSWVTMLASSVFVLGFSVINGYIRSRTNNVWGSILARIGLNLGLIF